MLPMALKLSDKVKIEGESSISGYEKQIDIEDLDNSLSMPMAINKSSNSRTSGTCVCSEFTCVMRLNKSYPKLLEACCNGSNLGIAELSMLKMTEGKVTQVMKYILTDVYVSEIRLVPKTDNSDLATGNSPADTSLPWVTAKFNYQSIAVTYNEFSASGEAKGAVSCGALTGMGG